MVRSIPTIPTLDQHISQALAGEKVEFDRIVMVRILPLPQTAFRSTALTPERLEGKWFVCGRRQ